MAKPPWARLTKPISPMVTERPTDTMNRTMPAATPPRSMLATSTPRIMRGPAGGGHSAKPPPAGGGRRWAGRACREGRGSLRGARPDLLVLAGVLDAVDLPDDLLEDAAVPHDCLRQILVHHDVTSHRVDHDGTAGAVELPALQRLQRLVGL